MNFWTLFSVLVIFIIFVIVIAVVVRVESIIVVWLITDIITRIFIAILSVHHVVWIIVVFQITIRILHVIYTMHWWLFQCRIVYYYTFQTGLTAWYNYIKGSFYNGLYVRFLIPPKLMSEQACRIIAIYYNSCTINHTVTKMRRSMNSAFWTLIAIATCVWVTNDMLTKVGRRVCYRVQ